LQKLYEAILGKNLDKRNFRKKINKMDLIKKLKEKESNSKTRAAYLYKFDKHNYNRLKEKGFILNYSFKRISKRKHQMSYLENLFGLKNKTAIITGATGVIGSEIAFIQLESRLEEDQ